jgi:hypothetical protein
MEPGFETGDRRERTGGRAGKGQAGEESGIARRRVDPQQQQCQMDDGDTSTWAIMLDIWPLEDRPEKMTIPRVVNTFTFDQMVKYKKTYEALQKKEGKGDGVFGKDSAIPTKKFQEAEDNCLDLLHPAR